MFGLNRVEEGFKTEEEEEKIVIWQQFSWDFPSVSKLLGNFYLRKQQFIELVREGRNVDAFDFAVLHLRPCQDNMASLKQVEEVVSLLVFENLSTCPVKDFLGESQWLKTATEVNAAILSSFGKGPKLQRLLKKLTLNQKKLDERACEYPRMSDMSTGELIYPRE
ncbi:hypothetical protein Bca52824_002796 [Brassica carinata]|uniref:CTLH domain-containing protein n=1 Tax=Brassica carinata TaxID=52824 RepID=A0A8X7WKY1_BRACI|nr:hypothetical protein Bca52824_002796 [Brassica carinata]